MDEVVAFRSSKRRKTNRVLHQSQEEPTPVPASRSSRDEEQQRNRSDVETQAEDGSEIALSNLIRARKQHRRPVTGVQFSTTKPSHERGDEGSESAVAKADQSVDKPIDITNRFVSSTGQVIDVDQHMVAFIDAELARRRNRTVSPSTPTPTTQPHVVDNNSNNSNSETATSNNAPPTARSTQPHHPAAVAASASASVRQLAEVDLGSSAHDLNLARTQAALERAKAGQPPLPEDVPAPKPRKPRIGRDGKPFRPRPRKRRNSEDLARDALVEQVLHEHKFDIYDVDDPAAPSGTLAAADADASDADERLAEQFRQEFMDAMAERHHRGKASTQSKASGAGATESKGPKLGGGRSARAKMALMHQQQQQQQQGQSSVKK